MSARGLSVLAVVPARGGSKSIPRKNMKPIAGFSLIGHAARTIKALDWVDAAILSTDDDEIAVEGCRHGLDVPFMRPTELASDNAKSVDMWRHAWLAAEEHYDRRFDIAILVEPTSPLRHPEDLTRTVNAMLDTGSAAAATVSRTPAHYTPHKTLTVEDGGRIGFYLKNQAPVSIRQMIPAYYHRNGVCYAVRRATLIEGGTVIEGDCVAVIIDRPLVNIDDQIELEWAEFLFNRHEG
jgi:CMP-N,N'-diacetyllegionaminic acid synthase